MINLLPPEIKASYRFGRRNVSLRHWVAGFMVAFIGLGLIVSYGMISLKQSTRDYQRQIIANETRLNDDNYAKTQKQAQDISNSFKLVLKVLGKEVLFSELLKQVGAIIPANANLTGLTINQTQGAIDITAIATDYNAATQVQVNLGDPKNKVFSKADILSINCTPTGDVDTTYPCTVTIRALFTANNPYLFINSKAVKP